MVDAKGHLLGRLASIVAKQLLNGKSVVVVRCEEINMSGSFFRAKRGFGSEVTVTVMMRTDVFILCAGLARFDGLLAPCPALPTPAARRRSPRLPPPVSLQSNTSTSSANA